MGYELVGSVRRVRYSIFGSILGGALLAGLACFPPAWSHAASARAGEPLGSGVGAQQNVMPISFSQIVKQVRPAVVSLKTKVQSPATGVDGVQNLPDDHPLSEFFRRFMDEGVGRQNQNRGGGERSEEKKYQFSRQQGSGFIISEDGYVVTNNHVVADALEVSIIMDDGTEYQAKRIGVDSKTDLALLKIEASKPLPYVAFSKDDIEIGDWIIAVGNPFGLGGSVTAGIVSARGRDIGAGPYDDFIQIDAPINRGNSGGPAFNLRGQVVGVNTAIFSPSGGNVGIAFAIPANVVVSIIEQLKAHGGVKRGWLGVRIQKVTEDIAASLGLHKAKGAIISGIAEDGPARVAGLKDGDLILKVDGDEIGEARDLARKVAALAPGSVVKIVFMRDGQEKTMKVTLGNQPAQGMGDFGQSGGSGELELKELGLTLLTARSSQWRGNPDEQPQGQDGVLITQVDGNSEAADKGLQSGDIIVEVGGVPVRSPSDVVREVGFSREKGRKAVLMRINAADELRYIALTLPEKPGKSELPKK